MKTYNVTLKHHGQEYTIPVAENEKILEVANAYLDENYPDADEIPDSCLSGVCTTCAGKITNGGQVEQADCMGLSKEIQEEGYALLCIASPRSDLVIETEKEDEVYQKQFGRP